MEFKHSFIISAYGESPFLEECVQSLLTQTEQSPISVITSTDNSHIRNIATKYQLRLSINNDGGIGKDWNFALHNSRTPLVTIAHQDDIYLQDYASTITQSIENQPDALIAFTDYREIRGGSIAASRNKNLLIKSIMLRPLATLPQAKWFRRGLLSFGNPICCPSVTYNLELIGRNFEFDTRLQTNLDWKAWEKLSKMEGGFIYIPEVLINHRIHENSVTSSTISENIRSNEDLEILKLFWPTPIAKAIHNFYKTSEDANQL